METHELIDIMQRVSQALNELAQYHKQKVIVVVHDMRKRNLQTTFYNQRELGATTIIATMTADEAGKENLNG